MIDAKSLTAASAVSCRSGQSPYCCFLSVLTIQKLTVGMEKEAFLKDGQKEKMDNGDEKQ